MPTIPRNMGNQKITEHMRGAICGVYKVGKSWLLATAPPPVLDIDLDLRADSLAGKPGVYCASIAEPAGINQQPTAYSETLTLVGRIEKSRRIGDIFPELSDDPCANEKIKSLGLDSIQSMARAIDQHNLYTGGKDITREVKVAGQILFFAKGWDAWNAGVECMEQLIGRLVGIPEIDLWVTFHEDDPKDGRVMLYPKRHAELLRYFNEVWRLTRVTNVPVAQLAPNNSFAACTTLIGAPDYVDNPNIRELVAKYGKK